MPAFPASTLRSMLLAAAATVATMAVPAQAQDARQAKQAQKARNIILFLGDAGGVSTINAAGLLAHDKPQSLFIHSMPHVALSDTSALDKWVTDSAAGMTAIVTGHKTNNAMVSMVPGPDGTPAPVKSLLEYAEQRGLSTGVVTNMPIWDATPAANYSHVAARSNKGDIFQQMLKPRFGNGVDIILGRGRKDALAAFTAQGSSAEKAFDAAGYRFGEDPALIASSPRAAILRDSDFVPLPAVEATIGQLARNPKGYFLMVEWDMHTDKPQAGLRHVIEMDDMIRRVSAMAGPDTLILFTADHSFGLRMTGGRRDTPLADQYDPAKPGIIGVEDSHTGEEVIVAASGPGAERVRGFMSNTRLFDIMMSALGWKKEY